MKPISSVLLALCASTLLAPPAEATAAAAPVKTKTFEARGIYLTATSMAIPRGNALVARLRKAGGNTVVFDAKDEEGIVSWPSAVPLAKEVGAFKEASIRNLKKRVDELHAQGIHVVGRICLFHDPILARHRHDLALKTLSGSLFLEKHKPAWVDPNLPAVQRYNLDLAKDLIANGVDEVQFDYIRYPAQGKVKDIAYGFDLAKRPKHQVITGFLQRAFQEVHALGKLVSIDVYGVIAWQQNIDERITGQRVQDLAKYADAICPMVYPSHFGPGFDKYAQPGAHPYYFVNSGVARLLKLTASSGVTIRPWLQAMPYRAPGFSPEYVSTEMKAGIEAKAIGYSMWNASNKYDVAFAGMTRYYKK